MDKATIMVKVTGLTDDQRASAKANWKPGVPFGNDPYLTGITSGHNGYTECGTFTSKWIDAMPGEATFVLKDIDLDLYYDGIQDKPSVTVFVKLNDTQLLRKTVTGSKLYAAEPLYLSLETDKIPEGHSSSKGISVAIRETPETRGVEACVTGLLANEQCKVMLVSGEVTEQSLREKDPLVWGVETQEECFFLDTSRLPGGPYSIIALINPKDMGMSKTKVVIKHITR